MTVSKSQARNLAIDWKRKDQEGPYKPWPGRFSEVRLKPKRCNGRVAELGYRDADGKFWCVVRLMICDTRQVRVLRDYRDEHREWPKNVKYEQHIHHPP